jgi:high-affinity Fe2+/Pb2+ permease
MLILHVQYQAKAKRRDGANLGIRGALDSCELDFVSNRIWNLFAVSSMVEPSKRGGLFHVAIITASTKKLLWGCVLCLVMLQHCGHRLKRFLTELAVELRFRIFH